MLDKTAQAHSPEVRQTFLDPAKVEIEGAGFIYFLVKTIPSVKDGNVTYSLPDMKSPFTCKIGYTKNPIQTRIRNLQTGNDSELAPIVLVSNLQYMSVERSIHKFLQDGNLQDVKPLRGEWYILTLEAIDTIVHRFGEMTFFKEVIMHDCQEN